MVKCVPHDKAHFSTTSSAHDHGIHIAHVIGEHQYPTLFRDPLVIHGAKLVNQTHNREKNKAQQMLRQKVRGVDGGHEHESGQREELTRET